MAATDAMFGLEGFAGPGHWNDPDNLGTAEGLTDTEGQTQFSLWCIFAAPLLLGNDVTSMSAATLTTISNAEAIAIDQDSAGIQGVRVARTACGDANCEVYAKQLSGGAWAIVMLNRASTSQSISATWASFGQSGPFNVRDIWAHSNLGSMGSGYTTTVASHAAAMLKLTP
jgi:alpha-galactosidase